MTDDLVKRLRELADHEFRGIYDTVADRIESLSADAERLREALRNIRALSAKQQWEGGPHETFAHIEGFARTALEGKTE